MALEKLLEAIVPEDIQAFIRAITTPEDYLLTREVFAERNIDNVKFRTKSSKRRVNAAKFRAWEAAPTLARRRAEQVINEGMLPWVGQELPFSELQIILAAVDRGQDTSEFLDLLYDDLEQHVEATKAAMEIAAGQMLSTGVVSLPGVALDVDWKVPAATRPTVVVPWSQSDAATPITDELAWIQYLKSIGAPRPERVISSEKALSLLGSTAEYRAAFHNSPSTEQIPTGMLAPEEANRVRAKYNLPPVTTYARPRSRCGR
ncbi:major capsid protein [Streptomyces hokutonensis]|uniref:major capsid protein n=1 Tax=Streptomyces hokutonensis TaxID=1306990 RepID=UPI0037F781C8